jgi:hypothetical protein
VATFYINNEFKSVGFTIDEKINEPGFQEVKRGKDSFFYLN